MLFTCMLVALWSHFILKLELKQKHVSHIFSKASNWPNCIILYNAIISSTTVIRAATVLNMLGVPFRHSPFKY